MNRLESLITPIVANVKRVDALLAKNPNDSKLQAVRAELQSVLAQQKESLNVISGFIATEQLGEIQGAGAPDNWAWVFSSNPRSNVQPAPAPAFAQPPAAKNLFSAGVHNAHATTPRDPRYDAKTVGPTYDPFAPFVAQIEEQRATAQTSESNAAKLVADAVTQCAP